MELTLADTETKWNQLKFVMTLSGIDYSLYLHYQIPLILRLSGICFRLYTKYKLKLIPLSLSIILLKILHSADTQYTWNNLTSLNNDLIKQIFSQHFNFLNIT